MTVLARFTLEAENFDLGQVLAGTNAEIVLTQLVPIENALVPFFWATDDHDIEAFERGVRADPRVASLERLDSTVDRSLYRIHWAEHPNGLLDALRENNVLVEGARCVEGLWTFRLRTADRESLQGFVERCHDRGIKVDLRQITNNPSGHHQRFGLTPKQFEALQLAFSRGYFEVPRRVSQGELADEVGITRQAFARRLKRALNTLLSSVLVENEPFYRG